MILEWDQIDKEILYAKTDKYKYYIVTFPGWFNLTIYSHGNNDIKYDKDVQTKAEAKSAAQKWEDGHA